MEDGIQNRRVNRRRLLRRAGTVAAGVAGAGVASAVVASPASAAPNDNMIIGVSNDAAATTTGLTSSASGGTLNVANSNGAPQVTFGASMLDADRTNAPMPARSLQMTTEGTLWTGMADGTPNYLRSWGNSTEVISFSPVRVLDMRDSATFGNVMNPDAFDSQSYVKTNTVLNLSLDSLLIWGWTIFLNVSVVGGGQYGFLTVYPYGDPTPNTSNLLWTPGALATNFCCTAIGSKKRPDGSYEVRNAISIYAQTRAFVVVDAFAVVANSQFDLQSNAGLTTSALKASKASQQRVRPANL